MKNLLYFLLTLLAVAIIMVTQSCGSRSGERTKKEKPLDVVTYAYQPDSVKTEMTSENPYPSTISYLDMLSYADAELAFIKNERTSVLTLPYTDYSAVYTFDKGYNTWYYLTFKVDD